MSLLAKVLAVLNVLAAVGFATIAFMDWSQRERWAYAVWRHDLFVEGFPIDAKEKDAEGLPRVDKLTLAKATEILPSSTGNAVQTQEQEVDRVGGLVQAKIRSADVQGTASQKLARYLRHLARSSEERDRLTALAEGPDNQDAVPGLEKQLNDELAGAKESAGGHTQTIAERKARAARLLYCLGEALNEDPANDFIASKDFKRFVNIVGLAGAASAIDDQATILENMTAAAMAAHAAERRQFIYDHGQILYNAQNVSDDVDRQDRLVKAKEKDIARQQEIVKERQLQIEDLRKRLKEQQDSTGAKLAAQTAAEEDVMKNLIDLRDTGKRNQELEKHIRELERQVSGAEKGEKTP
jgi:hypothetical protein